MSLPKVLLISLGGTITMTRGKGPGIVPTLTAADLVQTLPQIENLAHIETLSPFSSPGASLSIDNLIEVAALIEKHFASGTDGVVVIQGTDTIEETAFALDLLVKSDRPVIVTGAMRGPEAPGADGPANVLAATIVAGSRPAVGLGALVVLNDEVHAARFVQKSHTAIPSAFTSPLAGAVGLVAEGKVHFHVRPMTRPEPIGLCEGPDMPVAIVKMSLGESGRLLAEIPRLGYRGVVVEGMGAGHVPASVSPIVGDIAKEMPVVLATRVATGPAFTSTYAFPGSEIDLLGRGAISAGFLSSLKARLLLTLLLRKYGDPALIGDMFRNYS
ncbi:MAG: asparaginase [Hyphomicrobiales bacterium]|nr:asparaginase [Hyphomicrobiales bacterium]